MIQFINRIENSPCYLRYYGISECFDRFPAPCRKGDSVQFGGNPIISATYRGLSRKPAPARYSPLCIATLAIPLLRVLRLAGRLAFVASFTVGVGRSPIFAAIASVGRSDAFGDRLRFMRPLPASIAVGVGSMVTGKNTVLPFSHRFRPCV